MNETLRLGVNVDHVATIRQARGTDYPDPVEAARIAERAGAGGITAHLREDRRHIHDRDIERLRTEVTTKLNLEMAATDEMVAIARRVRPEDCCLVPERREELTTEGGLRVAGNENRLRAIVGRLGDAGIRVSLFIDPDPAEIAASAAVGATVVELHTGTYAEAAQGDARDTETERLRRGATLAREAGLIVNAGHGLTVENVGPLAALPGIVELNIGHSIVARAVLIGMHEAVTEMLTACRQARQARHL